MNDKKKLNRRDALKTAALGTAAGSIALEQLAGVPLFGTWFSEKVINPALTDLYPQIAHLDSFQMIRNALTGGSAMLRVHDAMAQSDDWTLVQIKVVNHVYAPLVFKLGELDTGTGVVTTTGNAQIASSKAGAAATVLQGLGVDEISEKPRYQALRFNKWFANMLHEGTSDGLAPGVDNMLGLEAADVQPLDDTKVAVQAFLGLGQITSNNHSLKGCKLRSSMSDLSLFVAENELINSPLGITCLMMGNEYDKAEGALGSNAVLGASDTSEVSVIGSRNVRDYVAQVRQYVGVSYADRASIEQNVVYRLDQLVVKQPNLRRELINSLGQFRNGLGQFGSAADLESTRQTLDATIGNRQSTRSVSQGTGATSEFLAQCKYVVKASEMSGSPLRNFSLMLNIVDLDSALLDTATVNTGGNAEIQALSYVEGMRQLAMGLNMLGKAIAGGKKMIVVVHSEGGRGANLQDSVTSFAMVMGPQGSGNLTDKLYANMNAINQQQGGIVNDHAAGNSAMAWDVSGLKNRAGNAIDDGVPNTGDVQMGVVQFLEEKVGKNVRSELSEEDGRFVLLERA